MRQAPTEAFRCRANGVRSRRRQPGLGGTLREGRTLPIPDFVEMGDLPLGIHQATLVEAVTRFGSGSARRRGLASRLRRIHRLAVATGHLARFIVFGSFVTAKLEPNDVDVFMVMEDSFDVA